MTTRKILYSPGFGAGWSTWSSGEMAKFMATYQPIIDHLDATVPQALLDKLVTDCRAKFNDEPYLGGADNLRVWTGEGRVKIEEYDGSECIVPEGDMDWF